MFLGSAEKNCEDIATYIRLKMKTNCLNYINGPAKKFVRNAVSNPVQGIWKGIVNYYSIKANTIALAEADNNLYQLEVTKEWIRFTGFDDKNKNNRMDIKYKDIRWACNDFGMCNLWEYINYLKKLDPKDNKQNIITFENMIKKIRERWVLNDINMCFVIDSVDLYIVCPRDPNEEVHIRTAIAVSTDNKLIDADSSQFKMNPLNEEYFISYTSESNPFISQATIRITKNKVVKTENHKNADTYLDFLNQKDINDIPCAFEYRYLGLPVAFHEFNPLCCAKFVAEEDHYICIQNQAKCYIELRRMLNTMKERCLITKGLKKDKYDGKGWKGKVVYNQIDNYKYKGESDIRRGILEVRGNDIIITDNKKDSPLNFVVEHITLKFICLSDHMCSPDEYKSNQEPFLRKGYDREWQESTFTKFWVANKDTNQDDCLVLTSENEEQDISQMILVCTIERDEG
jgi:hypothetical protein